jgi:hypothetical protein
LAEPEIVALLQAAPQARRVLAPLCRMLGIEMPRLAPGVALVEGAGSDVAPARPVTVVPVAGVVGTGGAFQDTWMPMGRSCGWWRRDPGGVFEVKHA